AALALAATGGSLAAQASGWARGHTCERDGEPHASLGVGTFHCQGGSCLVGGIYATPGTGLSASALRLLDHEPRAWDFSVEPRLWEIEPGGPAAGRVHEGDVLLAVDGAPVTTREAGLTLSRMEVGTPVELTLGRGSEVVRVDIEVVESCSPLTASSGPEEIPVFLERDAAGRLVHRDRVDRSLAPIPTGVGSVRFEASGLVLAGATEIHVAPDGSTTWWFTADPVVAEVVEGSEAQRLGIEPGEVIVTADDEPLTAPAGVAALAGTGPGHPVMLFVRRGRGFRQVEIHGG
ncbi:MAG TPA: PDZ domain-containing protein, partial [Longimicrobiales bacterium]|nr:PDZ domain-containing protein [Longimicrobiales bacterium]